MDEHQAAPTAPPPRSVLRPVLRPVLRLLILAGAAVVGWLVISGGPAQADDTGSGQQGVHHNTTDVRGPHDAQPAAVPPVGSAGVSGSDPAAGHTTPSDPGAAQPAPSDQALLQVPAGLGERTAAVVTDPVRQIPQQTSEVVDQVTATAPAPVRAAAQGVTATLQPTLTAATAGVATTIDRTVRAADAVVDPALQTAGLQAPSREASPSASGAAPKYVAPQRDRARGQHRAAPVAPVVVETPAVQFTGNDVSGHADGAPADDSPGVPSGPTTPAPPGSITVGAAAGVLMGLLLFAPMLLRRLGLADSDPLPAGPAYPPGSSPD